MMKIFYAVQATGNGHISRAMELLPFLKNYGEVDLFLSGSNNSLELNAPVKYRSKGISLFYTCDGRLDHLKMIKNLRPYSISKQIFQLPVEKYDLVINDFESITSLACKFKGVKSVHFGHQASFLSDNTPRPEQKSKLGEWILQNYATASANLGLHFEQYDEFILPPVIKYDIQKAKPINKGHILVYLPAYCDYQLYDCFNKYRKFQFHVFSHEKVWKYTQENITFIPVDKKAFNESLISCSGIITGGGFETPAEALYLNKKLISIPIKGQYEQVCNAESLKNMGIPVYDDLKSIDENIFLNWIENSKSNELKYQMKTDDIVKKLISVHETMLS